MKTRRKSAPQTLHYARALLQLPEWLFYTALLLLLLIPFHGIFSGKLLCYRDFYSVYAPPRLFLAEALRHGVVPLWDPYTGCGRDLLTELRAVIWYPLQLPLLPFLGARALTFLPMIHLFIAGAAMFASARYFHLPRPAALIAAASAILSHSMLAPIEFMWDAVLCWIPVNILCLLLYFKHRRILWLTAIAIVTTMQLTTHEVRAVVYGWLLLTALWLAHVWTSLTAPQRSARAVLSVLLALPVAGIATALLAMFWFLPMWAGNQISQFRQNVDFEYFANGSIPLSGLPACLIPWWNGQTTRGMWWNMRMYNEYWPQALFCGSWVWLFAPATIPLCLRRGSSHRAIICSLWTFFAFALLLALGKYGPLLRVLYDWFPPVRGARWPGVIMQSANFALLLLASFGLTTVAEWLSQRASRPLRFWMAWSVVVLAFLLWLRHACASPAFLSSTFGLDPRLSYRELEPLIQLLRAYAIVPLLTIILSTVLVGIASRHSTATTRTVALWGIVTLNAIELLYQARPLICMLDARAYTTLPESIVRLHRQSNYPSARIINGNNIAILNLALYGEHDWRKFLWYRSTAVAANHPMTLRVPSAIPPDPPPIGQPWYEHFARLFAPLQHHPDLLNFLSVADTWSVQQYGIPPYNPSDPYRNLVIARSTNWLPRITFPEHVHTASSDEDATAILTNAAFVFGRDAVVHLHPEETNYSGGARGATLFFHEDYNYFRATVTVARTGLAVINSSYHPDWHCYIDGQRVPALRVNYAFRGCIVPPGTHEIRFVYVPRLLYIGAVISGSTLLALLTLSAADWRFAHRPPLSPTCKPTDSCNPHAGPTNRCT